MAVQSERILSGQEEIMSYLRCGRVQFDKFKKLGLPVLQMDDGKWFADKENLDRWFAAITASPKLRKQAENQ